MTTPRPTGDPLAGDLRSLVARLRAEEPGDDLPGELRAPRPTEDEALAGGPESAPPSPWSAEERVAAARERIHATDGDVRAWVLLDERAPRHAAALDAVAADRRGPLHGTPIGVKDLVDVAGLPTRAGSRHWSGPGRGGAAADAPVVAALSRAGAVVLGKTTTHEFAFGGTTPPTRNPLDLTRIPGGSSGGSAAAVAAGHVRLAVGTDTCGSVRIPASYCGVVGFLPSAGLLPRDGVVPLAPSLDRVGLLAADVGELDAACRALGVHRGAASEASRPGLLRGLRVGIPRDALAEPIAADVVERFEEVVVWLTAQGARPTVVELPQAATAVAAGLAIFLAESLEFHRERWSHRPELFGGDVRGILSLAEQLGAADYVRAQRVRRALRAAWVSVLADVDLVLSPTMPTTAPPVDVAQGGVLSVGGQEVSLADAHLRYNVAVNLAALPAGTQPMGQGYDGLPLGLQWIGPPGADGRLLTVMAALEPTLIGARSDISSSQLPRVLGDNMAETTQGGARTGSGDAGPVVSEKIRH